MRVGRLTGGRRVAIAVSDISRSVPLTTARWDQTLAGFGTRELYGRSIANPETSLGSTAV